MFVWSEVAKRRGKRCLFWSPGLKEKAAQAALERNLKAALTQQGTRTNGFVGMSIKLYMRPAKDSYGLPSVGLPMKRQCRVGGTPLAYTSRIGRRK